MGKGGQKSSGYKDAVGKVEGVRKQMDELNQLVKSIGSVTAAIKARNAWTSVKIWKAGRRGASKPRSSAC